MRAAVHRSNSVGGPAVGALGNDEGSVSVEAALGMSALVVVVAAMVGALATLGAYLAAVDTAGAAARSLAIGMEFEPTRGHVESSESGGLVTVTARVPAPLGEVSATAVFPRESS